jgi:hypothetical protein
MKSNRIIVFVTIVGLLYACVSSDNKKKASEIDNISTEMLDESVQSIPAPNSIEMMKLINDAGIGYVFEITNPVENIDRYLSTKNKAISLGVYASDLSYTVVYQKKAETQAYLRNMLRLTEDLNISINAKKLSQRFETNLDNKDSLSIIVKDMVLKSQDILNQTSQNDIALYFLTGSWVESVYIAGVITNFTDNKKILTEVILKHEDYLKILLKYLEEKKDNEEFKDIYTKLSELKLLFEALKTTPDDSTKIEELKAKITSVRNTLV